MLVSPAKYTKQIHYSVDFLIINFAFFDGYFLSNGNLNMFSDNFYFLYILYFNISWYVVGEQLQVFNFNPYLGLETVLNNFFRALGFHILLSIFFWFLFKGDNFSRDQFGATYSIMLVIMLSWKMGLYYFLKFFRKQWHRFRSVVIVGYGDNARMLSEVFDKYPEYGYRFLGYFHDDNTTSQEILGSIEDLPAFIENIHIDDIYFSISDAPYANLDKLFDFADDNVIRFRILPDFKGITNKNLIFDLFEGLPVLSFRKLPLDDVFNRTSKRIFDVVFSGLVIILILSWLFPIVALLIKLTSSGPVFFKQKRTGKDNEDFWCLKFRSMYVNKDSDKSQARKGDARITPVGKFLRKTSLDEFPQFFNVFVGQMSIVGPRPHMLKHTEEYSQIIKKYMVRHFVKPGITGLAQVKGFRGETTDPKRMEGRVKFDTFYIENWSFLLDLKIIALTIINVLKGEENAA
ncbi:MAG: undecaprenyl-phosphate glucose phosphotransferase [Cytophagales bacterium]|nr:undecaprenyl-phosphate glucose phosphotransferase [Cytophagales bacterium]